MHTVNSCSEILKAKQVSKEIYLGLLDNQNQGRKILDIDEYGGLFTTSCFRGHLELVLNLLLAALYLGIKLTLLEKTSNSPNSRLGE